MRALILGGTGAVGRVISSTLTGRGWHVTTAGRQGATVGLNLREAGGLAVLTRHASEYDLVLNASGIEHPDLVRAAAPAAYLDISATARFLAELRRAAQPQQRVLLGVGLVPGLSTMLVAQLATQPGDEVDLGIILGSGERHGPAAVEWTAGLAGRPLFAPPEPHAVMNFRERRRLASPDGPRRYLRADFPDQLLADPDRALVIRSYLAVGDPATTAALSLVGRFPRLAPAMARVPQLGSDRWSLVASNRRTGAEVAARGRGQSRATGVLAALGAEALLRTARSGVHTLADLLPLTAVPDLR